MLFNIADAVDPDVWDNVVFDWVCPTESIGKQSIIVNVIILFFIISSPLNYNLFLS